MNRLLLNTFYALLMVAGLSPVLAQDNDWPRTLPLEQGMVTIYSLQVDQMNGDVIHFRAALAYRETSNSEPVFGAGWFESRVEIDQSARIVHPTDLKVIETRFPAGTDDVQSGLSAVLAQRSPEWNLDFSLDELEASLKATEAEANAVEKLNTAPPRIVYRDHPALLVSIDGEPVLRAIENSSYKAVINTPYPLISDGRHYYLNVARGVWYKAGEATGPYRFEANPPVDVAAMVDADAQEAADEQPAEAITAANAPEIVVSTEPAELIVTEGPAAFVPLVEDLLVLNNSDDDVFMHVSSQKFYIVLAGRWYQASSLNGPWAYQPADDLPAAFASIPQDSDQAEARVYVAGTQEARDAVLDAQVPQTAAVSRGEVDMDVEYDGDPNFEPVDGADLAYANNTGSTVIQSDGLYYLVEEGVWYVSSSPGGPWQVSDHRPQQVDSILPTSPVYNVKYVHVYDSTPRVVYVGYTPGYMGSYVYHNTLFYGSGWYYSPWVSPFHYYPRHSTWGFNVSYNWWNGWSFGLSWGWGPFSVGYYSGGYWHRNHYWHHRHFGRWGPGRYRPRPIHHGHGGNRYADRGHGRGGYGRNAERGHRSDYRERNDNLYRDGAQQARIADTRDRRPRTPGRRRDDSVRQPNYGELKKGGRSRTEPVRASEIRAKANERDANYIASRNSLLADNRGNVYSKAGRQPDRNRASDRVGGNRGAGRTAQSTAIDSSQNAKNRTKNDRARQRTTPAANVPVRQRQTRAENNRDRQRQRAAIKSPERQPQPGSINNRDRQQSRAAIKSPDRRTQIRTGSNRDSQRQRAAIKSPERQPQPGPINNRDRQQSRAAIKSPDRRTQTRTGSNRDSQRQRTAIKSPERRPQPGNRVSQQPGRMASAPAQRQSQSRPGPEAQRSRSSGNKSSTPARSAPQRSTQSSGGRRSGPKGDRGHRTGNSQSRRR
jgi:hypothetical protein